MIAVEMSGGLGNQMFKYAFIYAQHKQLKTPFFLVRSGAALSLYKYFHLNKNTFYKIDCLLFNYQGFKLLFSHYLQRAFYSLITKPISGRPVVINNTDDPVAALHGIKDNAIYHGYFQSEIYFGDRDNLDNIFSIKDKYIKRYKEKFAWLGQHKTVVAIHIRRTDYSYLPHLNLGGDDLTLPVDYYHDVISKIHHPDNLYIFLSDDADGIANDFDYLTNAYFSKEDEITDFQLMLGADTCIIANSTFSWWGAYLNSKKNKTVYCPEHFLGFLKGSDYPAYIYPSEWIKTPALRETAI